MTDQDQLDAANEIEQIRGMLSESVVGLRDRIKALPEQKSSHPSDEARQQYAYGWDDAIAAVLDVLAASPAPEPTPGLREAEAHLIGVLEDLQGALTEVERRKYDDRSWTNYIALIIDKVMQEVRFQFALAASPAPEPTGLDAAWAEAEAATTKEGEQFRLYVRAMASGYEAGIALPEFRGGQFVRSEYDTPAAALRSLAARLGEKP